MTVGNVFDPVFETVRSGEPILKVRGLGVDFSVDGSWVMASEDVEFDINPGEVLAVVGESGSGKSVSAMSLRGPRQGDRADLPGADDSAEPGAHRRFSDQRDAAQPFRHDAGRVPAQSDRV